MDDIAFEQRVIETARGWSSPQPTTKQYEQIISRRSTGDRVALPVAPLNGRSRRIWWISAATAAAMVGAILFRPGTDSSRLNRDSGPESPYEHLLMPEILLGQSVSRDAASGPDSFTIRNPDGAAVRPGIWVYHRRPIGGPASRPEWDDTIAIRADSYDSAPVWVLTWSRASQTVGGIVHSPSESVWARQQDLWPLKRSSRLANGYTLGETFSSDSSVSLFEGDGQKRIIHAPGLSPAGGAGVMGLAGIHALVQVLPFKAGWKGNFRALGMNNSGETVDFRLWLRVSGSERVVVPGGTYDCWKVMLGDEPSNYAFWVSKDRGWVIKEGSPLMVQGASEKVLTSYAPHE